MRAILHHVEDITPRIKTFWFAPNSPVEYIAGQFTELYLPHDNPDNRGIKRWFTLSSSPTEPLLGITTGFTPDGSTFKQALLQLPIGAEVTLADPMGDFVLPKDKTIPLLFVAGGLGITPVRSMLTWLTDTSQQRTIRILYSLHDPAETAYKSLLQAHDQHITILHKKTPTLPNGKADVSYIISALGDIPSGLLFLSGPEQMVEALRAQLLAKGVHDRQIVGDYFPGY